MVENLPDVKTRNSGRERVSRTASSGVAYLLGAQLLSTGKTPARSDRVPIMENEAKFVYTVQTPFYWACTYPRSTDDRPISH